MSTVLEPDVVFIGPAHPPEPDDRFLERPPEVVVEVSSPSTRQLELIRKREVYERFGVPEYWYVDLQSDRIEAYVLVAGRYGDPRMHYRGDTLTTPLAPGLEIPVDEALCGLPPGEPAPTSD